MPKRKDEGQNEEPKAAEKPRKGGTLEKAAEAVGSTLGTIVAKTGLAKPAKKSGKFPKTDKRRLPRKLKKSANKAKRA